MSSPKICDEAMPMKVAVFSKKASVFFSPAHAIPFNLIRPKKIPSPLDLSDPMEDKENLKPDCSCPHALIADDDALQGLFYQHLFLKSMNFSDLIVERENFRMKLFSSGEELVAHFLELKEKKCGCQSLKLVISDYNMGVKKLNGVETLKILREHGYKGTSFLRTSEIEEDLNVVHPDFQTLLKKKDINGLLDKSNHMNTKNAIQNSLRRKLLE